MSSETATAPAKAQQQPQGLRKNGNCSLFGFTLAGGPIGTDATTTTGKQWHASRKAFRPSSGLTSYEQRKKLRIATSATKAKEKEMKDEKEAERQKRVQAIKDKRAAKEEKERYQKMAEKMHKKRVERLKRKEKRNKLLNS
ncbi:hypothetical protein DL765_011027 [Monosporascus sp. GIB2]|nr:hypothetical protein DL765_011027 [Monosporascus sp. GIB2]